MKQPRASLVFKFRAIAEEHGETDPRSIQAACELLGDCTDKSAEDWDRTPVNELLEALTAALDLALKQQEAAVGNSRGPSKTTTG